MPKSLILLSLNSQISPNEKIKITPIGDFEGIDGRKYHLNADEVVERTKKLGTDIVLDENHEDGEAMGWFDIGSLEIKDDGIYASLALTKKGSELVANRSFRYLSPAFAIGGWGGEQFDVCEIQRIASIGLVNRPNLLSQALNNDNQISQEEEKMEKELAELKKQLEALKAENEALQAKINELEAEKAKAAEEANKIAENAKIELIDKAIENKELLPKRKEAALALNAQALSDFLEVAKSEAKAELATNSADNLNAPKQSEQIDPEVARLLDIEQ